MKELIERFYDSIRLGNPIPIPYRDIVLTAKIMDEIFAQIYPNRLQLRETRQGDEVDSVSLSAVH